MGKQINFAPQGTVKWYNWTDFVFNGARIGIGMKGQREKMVDLKTQAALEYLQKDYLLNIGMWEPLRRGNADLLAVEDEGVLTFDRESEIYMLAVSTPAACGRLIEPVEDTDIFTVNRAFCLDILAEKYRFTRVQACWQAAWLKPVPPPLPEGFDIRPLGREYVSLVLKHYSGMDDATEEYIASRVAGGLLFGAFVQGEIGGFMGLHDEGSMGMLEVLPGFRRRGIATALEKFMINRVMEKGWTPFGQIFEENVASVELQKRLGLELSTELMYWTWRP